MAIESELDFKGDRDATLKLISWFDIERVRGAKILVVGAGAIGNEVLKNLALLGVGNIYIFDMDTIEMSNLSRSVLYRPRDQGQSKALIAARAVKDLNPNVNAFWHDGDIATDLGEGLVRRMDVIVGCLDSVEARFLLNRLCWKVGRPWVDAGIGALNGHVRVFRPPDSACYECSFSEAHYADLSIRQSCNALAGAYVRQGRVPTTPTIASLVAAVQVQECLKLLDFDNWNSRTLCGRQFDFDGMNAQADVVGLPRREDCPAHDLAVDPDLIIELPEVSAKSKAGDLLAKAQHLLGSSAHLYLDFEIALERTCPDCGHVLQIFRPLHRIVRDDLRCDCGKVPQWESDITQTHIISGKTSASELLSMPLRDLGVPAFGIVEARGPNRAVNYLELCGDSVDSVCAV